ncbi:hypothetical protein F4819DRAFT_472375 [Hypoxylon fuscum]|nr:hypothetical protein F4819DRAFT_472375 [Hypoxylon fuscum]
MSATESLSVPVATPSSACGAQLYVIPVKDAACAMPVGGNHTDVMGACCGNADVVSYYDNCGLYCLSVGQSVDTLTQCLFDQGAGWSNVWCNKNGTSTATASDTALPTSAGASVVVTAGSSANPTSNDADSTSSPTDSPAAAAGLRPEFGSVTTLGLTIGALLFSATAFGAFQL